MSLAAGVISIIVGSVGVGLQREERTRMQGDLVATAHHAGHASAASEGTLDLVVEITFADHVREFGVGDAAGEQFLTRGFREVGLGQVDSDDEVESDNK